LWWDRSHGNGFLAAVVLITLAILVRGKARQPRIWLWLAGSLLALDVLHALACWGSLFQLSFPLSMVFWVMLGGAALWIAVDPRPAIAVAIYMACALTQWLGPIVFFSQPGPPWRMSEYSAAAAAAAAAAIWRLHRQAVL
jgi:hypothetical protein